MSPTRELAEQFREEIIALRRALHQVPEYDLELPKTQQLLLDALPVTERADVPFASQHPGMMHACGHDLHVAGLVGAAKVLCAMRAELAGDVVFMFQPGEETTGGAPIMIREGVLDAAGRRADAAYGLHVGSAGQPFGMWSSRPGS